MKRACLLLTVVVLLATVPMAWGHYTWLVRTHYSSGGDKAFLEIGNGHHFPESEAAPNVSHVKVFLVNAKGEQKSLPFQVSGKALAIEAPLAGKELARVYYVRDRGVMSQTAEGWKEGGRDQHPTAKQSTKMLQYGIAWVGFQGSAIGAKPLGLELELNYETGMRGRMVRVMRQGKPAKDIAVVAVLGEDNEIELGKSDAQGYVSAAKAPEGKAVLYSARFEMPATKGANFDKSSITCTLSVPGN
ncbi:MAG: DUF4198 domain-containing protein [Bryobacterales bacterium]|jgi:uncharacterized GH25 family protein|nr:DUF4198 domain-containing protein [Bryobacterales bacterium]